MICVVRHRRRQIESATDVSDWASVYGDSEIGDEVKAIGDEARTSDGCLGVFRYTIRRQRRS